jgi:hypothetical protein
MCCLLLLPLLLLLLLLLLPGCHQLDYDALSELLSSCSSLTHLDLQRSTVVLNSSGPTGQLLRQGRYRPPAQLQQQQQNTKAGYCGICNPSSSSSSSRRDICSQPSSSSSTLHPAAAAEQAGLQVLKMSECGLALEDIAWHTLPANSDNTPEDPSLLLLHLVVRSQGQLQQLSVLHWARATQLLVERVLCQIIPASSKVLSDLDLSGSCLPVDPARCWQGLAAATSLTSLDLSNAGFSRLGYANACGTNPTVAMLSAVAGMRELRELRLSGWRMYFASLHVLAGLQGSLKSLDLSGTRDVTDGALWSLTHLTGGWGAAWGAACLSPCVLGSWVRHIITVCTVCTIAYPVLVCYI